MESSKSPKNQAKNVVVLGVHRSGTSLVSNFIEKMGVWFGYDDEALVQGKDNPKGFWERKDVVNLNDQILSSATLQWHSLAESIPAERIIELNSEFKLPIELIVSKLNDHKPWFIKDPRLLLTWDIWKNFIDGPLFVAVYRDPISVSQSLFKRNAMPFKYGLALWLYQIKSMARILQQTDSKIVLSQEELTNSTQIVVNRIYEEISVLSNNIKPIEKEQITEVLDHSLLHHRLKQDDLDQSHPLIKHCWCLLEQRKFKQITELEIPITEFVTEELGCAWEELYRRELLLRESEFQIKDKNSELIQKIELVSKFENSMDNIASSLAQYKQSTSYRISTIPRLVKDSVKGSRSLTAVDEMEKTLIESGCRFDQGVEESLFVRIIKILKDNPGQIISKFSIRRLRSLFRLLRDPQTRMNLDQALARYEKIKLDYSLVLFKPGELDEAAVKLMPVSKPRVSIIIPVFNEYDSTIACLKSISEFTKDVSYEVILADDNSADATTKITEKINNLRVIRSEKNQGFLRNCNFAAEYATGQYILLLNNDTNVQAKWLSEMIHCMDLDESVGVVGSKLIYPDGRLQEAGGIIFKNASGWNYGRLDDPGKPEYCFIRDVDYVSGASLLIRKKLWDQLGGFDERFSPAYYEDTDICFSVRDLDYKVVFTPFSKVVHYEGVSHGTDETSGIKQHQKENQKVFREKWANTLSLKHQSDEKTLFLARNASETIGTVLVIDHYVPMHDKDAGSRSTRKYLELLVESKVRVIFLGDNFYPHQPYTEQLQRMGVEVLYGDYYQNNLSEWLDNYAQFIDSIYIHRPHIAEKYLKLLNDLNPCPRLVYFGHDLHYLRFLREYEITGDKNLLKQSKLWKEKETGIIRDMNLSLYPAQYEVDALKEIDPNYNVDAIPLMWFADEEIQHKSNLQNSMQIIFVGGFGHPPNIDGLMWFINEVWPMLVEQHNTVKLVIIGSKCPPQIQNLQSSNIIVLGEVDDKTLAEQYKHSRLAIVPLRFGAGIKGKVLEAMVWGVPVCTTSIGAEGLPDSRYECLLKADEPQEYLKNLQALLSNDALCNQLINESFAMLRSNFSQNSAKKLLSHLLPAT